MENVDERLHEKKQHGSTLFPFNIYPCTIPGDFPSVPLHWQQSMELIYIKKGKGKVQIGRNLTEALEGDIFVIPPGTLHALKEFPGNVMEYENIIFDVDFLGAGAVDICAREYLVPLAAGQLLLPGVLHRENDGYAEIAACLNDAENMCRERGKGYELGVKAAMLRVLFLFLHMFPEAPYPDSPDMERLKEVLRRIEEDYARQISVSEMAKICGCSSSHFMRWFKQMTGVSFVTYRNERRLAVAAEMLRQTDKKILDIAQSVGFENLSNFNRQFKARYGVTPKQYKKPL